MRKSYCKEGESLFNKCISGSIETKAAKKDDGASIITQKRSVSVPTLKAWQAKVIRPPPFGLSFLL